MSTDAETRPTEKSGDAPAGAEAPLRKLGKYVIEKKLGQGGMGAVYLGRDTELRRQVAIKVLPRDKASNPILVRRFKAEAQAAAQLRHDNIVAVFDSDEADGYLFIAMEYVDGHDLHEMISRRGPIPVKRSIEIIKQVTSALQHAHEHKIVHRDIKPSNLLIRRDGAVKVTDLGLARSVDDTIETGITRAGTTVGTVDYMAPEQARNSKSADIRSDIYSLGCTWYQMLTGHAPYPEGSLTNKLQAHAVKPIPDPSSENKNVTEGLVAVIQRMMAKKPEDRYQTPADLLQDLEASSLTRAAFSQEIFNAINEESATAVPSPPTVPAEPVAESASATSGKSRRGQRANESVEQTATPHSGRGEPDESGKARKGGKSLPPPRRPRQMEENTEDRPASPWGERMKMIAVIGGIIAVVGGLSWLITGVGGVFDSSGIVVVPQVDPGAEAPVPGVQAPAVAAVSGGVVQGDQIDTTTAVARVFSSNTVPGNATSPGTPGAMPPGTSSLPGGGGSSTGTSNSPAISSASLRAIQPANADEKPKWPSSPAAAPGGSAFVVGPGPASSQHFSSLNDALLKLPPDGGVIKLVGSGPYALSLTVPIRAKRLTLLGDPDQLTLVVLSKSGSDQLGHLDVQGDLEISHIHFVADRNAHPTEVPVTLVGVREGSLDISQSSLTLLGTGGLPITALGITGGNSPRRLACRRTVIRGDFSPALRLEASAIDAVVDESLLVTEAGSLIQFQGSSGMVDSDTTSRWLRCFASTLCSRGTLVDLSVEQALSEPPKTELLFREVLGTTGSVEGPRVLLNVLDWLQQSVREQLVWKNVDSTFLGFDQLIELGNKSSFKASTPASWRQFWRQTVEDREFVDALWPSALGLAGTVSPQVFDRDGVPAAARQLSRRGEYPGVPVQLLSLPETVFPERLAALAARPSPPTLSWPTATGSRPSINMRENDLGQVLANTEWADGTVFDVVGYGVCTTSPVKITGKRLKLVFRQLEGGPFRVMPKESSSAAQGLFEVDHGTLELVGLRAQFPSVRPRFPAYLVAGIESIVRLDRCELRGPETAAVPYEGLVRMVASPLDEQVRVATVIDNSVLVGAGSLVSCAGGGGQLFAHNSIFAADDRPFDLELAARGTTLPFVCDISGCSLSSAGAVLQVRGAKLEMPPERRARCFVESCAILPPGPWRTPSGSTPTLLRCVGPVIEQQQLDWWGRNNGLVKEIRTLIDIQAPGEPRTILTPAQWAETWGPGHDVQLLSGTDGVVMKGSLAGRWDQLDATQFELHSASKAYVWSDGAPLGADIAQLRAIGPESYTPPTAPAGSKTATPGTSKTAVPKKPAF